MTDLISVSGEFPWSPLTFIRPDTLVHVHDLWAAGTHEHLTCRTYAAVFEISELQPFVVNGLHHLWIFLHDWKFSSADIQFLRSLPSLGSFEDEFWAYLEALRFTGNINAVPEGTVFGTQPVEMSDEMRVAYHYEGKSPFPILTVEAAAAQVALITEFLSNIFSECTLAAMKSFDRRKKYGGMRTYYYGTGELCVHPLYALIEIRLDIIMGHQPLSIFEQERDSIAVVWKNGERDRIAEIDALRVKIRSLLRCSTLIVFVA